MSLPKRNSSDGRCHWMKPEVQEELQPLFDQCIQDAPEVVEAAPAELKERYQEIFQ